MHKDISRTTKDNLQSPENLGRFINLRFASSPGGEEPINFVGSQKLRKNRQVENKNHTFVRLNVFKDFVSNDFFF